MPLKRINSPSISRKIYAGQMEKVTLLKRKDDQQEGQVVAYTLFECRRGNISKTGEPIQLDMTVSHSVQWVIPAQQLLKISVNYLNVLDRIIDKYGMWWQPESNQTITLSQFDQEYIIDCVRIDPTPNIILLGKPGVNVTITY